jgi:hypothetical protein
MPIEKRDLIPQPLKGEVTVKLVLPDEALRLMNDLHQDRQGIAVGGVILIACVTVLVLKRLLAKEQP